MTDGGPAGVVWEAVLTPAGTTAVVVSVTGEIDMLNESQLVEGLSAALNQPGAVAVVVDLSQVTFFSSSGIAALAHAHATALEQHLLLQVVVPAGSATYRPLHLTGMTELLTIYPTVSDALAGHRGDVAELGSSDPNDGR